MAVTSLAPDQPYYSRYEPQRDTIQCRVRYTFGVNTPVTINLERSIGTLWKVVASNTPTLLSSATTATSLFVLDSILDAAGIYAAPAGTYRLALSDESVVSQPFQICIITPQDLRVTYLRGVPLQSRTIEMTGFTLPITGYRLGDTWQRGVHQLVYNHTARTLALSGGAAVTIPSGDGPFQVTLTDIRNASYVIVTVDGWSLPAVDVTDNVLIDYATVEDSDLQKAIVRVAADLSSLLGLDLEPKRYSTPQLIKDEPAVVVDDIIDPVAAEPIHSGRGIWPLTLKRPLILNIERLTGYLATQSLLDVPSNWEIKHYKSGRVDLAPIAGDSAGFTLVGIRWLPMLSLHEYIPNFWHARMVCGLRDLYQGPRLTVREAVARMAVLNLGGYTSVSLTGGRASINIGRDGVSESLNFNQNGPWGPMVQDYTQWLQEHLPRLRRQLVGTPSVMM